MDDNLGMTIKKLRKNQKLTLKNLAEETGFSISFLSQLERGKSSATLESLKKISQALGVEPGFFFKDSSENKELIHRDALETQHMKKHKIYYKSLHNSITNPAFSPQLVILEPQQNEGNLIKHAGQEFLYVLEGELTVQIDNKSYILKPSESIMFDSSDDHYWYNYTTESVKFLCVNYDEPLRS